jgi:hypothetical protein
MKRSTGNRILSAFLPAKLILLLNAALLPFRAAAQYPFEQYPSILYQASGNWQFPKENATRLKVSAAATVHAGPKKYTLQVFNRRMPSDTFYIAVSEAGGAQRQFLEPWYLLPESLLQPVRVADINGDGLTDLKLVVNAVGGGAVRGLVRLVYLFGQRSGGFVKMSFLSFHDGPERDFDGDANYELMVRELVSYKGHSYWTFNVFSFTGEQLVNVSHKYGYPILIQFLNKPNFKVTDKVSAQEARQFLLKQPREYDATKE